MKAGRVLWTGASLVLLTIALLCAPAVLIALFIRWLWRRSAGTTTIRA